MRGSGCSGDWRPPCPKGVLPAMAPPGGAFSLTSASAAAGAQQGGQGAAAAAGCLAVQAAARPRVGVSCRPGCRFQVGGARVRVGRKGGIPAAPLDRELGRLAARTVPPAQPALRLERPQLAAQPRTHVARRRHVGGIRHQVHLPADVCGAGRLGALPAAHGTDAGRGGEVGRGSGAARQHRRRSSAAAHSGSGCGTPDAGFARRSPCQRPAAAAAAGAGSAHRSNRRQAGAAA